MIASKLIVLRVMLLGLRVTNNTIGLFLRLVRNKQGF